MRIQLSPQIRPGSLTVVRRGDVLVINGATYDLSPLPEGAVLPATAVDCEYVVGSVTRVGGQIQLTLLLPIGWDAPPDAAFPDPIIDPPDGPINLPGAQHD